MRSTCPPAWWTEAITAVAATVITISAAGTDTTDHLTGPAALAAAALGTNIPPSVSPPYALIGLVVLSVLLVGVLLWCFRLKTHLVRQTANLKEGQAALVRAEKALQESWAAERLFQKRVLALIEAINQLSEDNSVDDLCRHAVELGRSRLGFDRLSIWLRSEEPGLLVGSFGTDETGQVRDEREHVLELDILAMAREVLQQETRTVLSLDVPLRDHRGEIVGQGMTAAAAMWDGETATGLVCTDNLLTARPIRGRDCEILALYASCLGDLCSRKRAEQALRASQARFRELFDAAPVGYHELDAEGRIVRVNRSELEMLGYTAEQMQGRPVWEFVVEQEISRNEVEAKITGVMPPGKAFERTYRRKDGSTLPVLIEDRLLRDADGRITGMRSTIQAIAERVRADEERKVFARLGTRLSAATTVDSVADVLRGETERLLRWDAFYFTVRLPHESDFRVVSFCDIVDGEKTVFSADQWPQANLSPPVLAILDGCPVLINRKPGDPNPLLGRFGNQDRASASLMFVPVLSGDRIIAVLSAQSYTYDRYGDTHLETFQRVAAITAPTLERVFAEEAERHSRMVAEAVATAGLCYLETGSIREVAQIIMDHAVALTGAHIGTVINIGTDGTPRMLALSTISLKPSEGPPLCRQAKQSIQEKGFFPLSFGKSLAFFPLLEGATVLTNSPRDHPAWTGTAPDGHPPIDSFLGVPIKIADKVVGMIALANRPGGFTSRERRDTETFANTAALALRAAYSEEERGQVEQQLRQAQKMEAVGRLAGGIAHDFNNLLTTILGYADRGAQTRDVDKSIHQCFSEIQQAAARAATLTAQLLAFSRRQPFEPRVVNLNEVFSDMDRMLRRLIGEDVELVADLAEGLWPVRVDVAQLEQVIINLAINARDAMPRGGTLTLAAANVELDEHDCHCDVEVTPGQYVMLAISDTGTGMTDEVKAHLFEPFFTTKEVGKGTGLGLATCYGIVKKSDGHICAVSEMGRGTTFRIFLPHVWQEPVARRREQELAFIPKGSETVLLTEDEPSVRRLAAEILREAGYTVLEADTGVAALDLCLNHGGHKIDLLLSDVIMPQMGGRDLAERLRAANPELKVLFISGYTKDDVSDFGTQAPGYAFMSKPFTPAALARKVREVLDS